VETPNQPSDRTPLEEFVAVVAHEVRGPLGLAKMGVEALTSPDEHQDDSGVARAEVLAMIERNVDLAMLLMDRMSLARDVEEGQVVLDRRPLDLAELVGESVSDLRLVLGDERPIGLTAPDEAQLSADGAALRQIMLNLISNAAKYSPHGTPIEVSIEVDEGTAHVAVCDHGKGVSLGDSERVFDKFFQRSSDSPGLGLGLFVSRGLARAHDGDLVMRTATRRGSEFVLSLPAGSSQP
jgi:signal transduction histidine kinase